MGLTNVGTVVEVTDLRPGDWVADEVGEPVQVRSVRGRVITTTDDDVIDVPEGITVTRLSG